MTKFKYVLKAKYIYLSMLIIHLNKKKFNIITSKTCDQKRVNNKKIAVLIFAFKIQFALRETIYNVWVFNQEVKNIFFTLKRKTSKTCCVHGTPRKVEAGT